MVVLSEDDGGVRILTFNRPERLNAWTAEMGRRYFDLLEEADRDPSVRAIVVTGAGKGFCAGADFADLTAIQSGEYADEQDPRPNTFPTTLRTPVVAAVNGACAGLGMVHALVCDVVVTADDAKWTTAFSRRGLVAEYGLGWILPRLAGQARAMDLLLSGRVFTGAEACAMGLAVRAVPGSGCSPRPSRTRRSWPPSVRPPRWRSSSGRSGAAGRRDSTRPGTRPCG